MSAFVPMAGPVRDVFEVLAEHIDFECNHEDKHGHVWSKVTRKWDCPLASLVGLEQAANAIVERMGKTDGAT